MSKFVFTFTSIIDNLIKSHESDILRPLNPFALFDTLIGSFIVPSCVPRYWGLIKTDKDEYTLGYFLFNWLIKLISIYDPIRETLLFDEHNLINKDSIEKYADFVLPYYVNKDAQLCCYKICCLLINKEIVPNKFVNNSTSTKRTLPSINTRINNYKRRHSSSSSSSAAAAAAASIMEQDPDIIDCANHNFADPYGLVKTPTVNTIINLSNGTTNEELNGEINDFRKAYEEDEIQDEKDVDYTVPHCLSPTFIKDRVLKFQNSVFRPMNTMKDLIVTLPPRHFDIISKINYYSLNLKVELPDKDFEKYLTYSCDSFVCLVTNYLNLSKIRPPILHHRCVYDVLYETQMTQPKFLNIIHQLANYIQYLKSKPKEKLICAICLLVNSLTEEKASVGLNLCNIIKELQINKCYNIINTLYTVTTDEQASLKDIEFIHQQKEGQIDWIVKYRDLIVK